ncbi:DUF5412 domain-containing protein [Bacillus sp. REN3]|uniref:DUF5412 domain-containing protein n=1 Tax=Bacillus sp. REN3 TaxID=2802440 RepID=UPI001AEDAE9F|nr:DUF5412 domain-containing protein [Bacillus sp. REN3]
MIKKRLVIPFVILGLFGYGVHWAFFDLDRLPKGELIDEVSSPGGAYTVRAYVTNGGATTDYAIRGELIFNRKNKKPKNIYWNYHEEKAYIVWLNENTVRINGHELSLPNETFDFRRD